MTDATDAPDFMEPASGDRLRIVEVLIQQPSTIKAVTLRMELTLCQAFDRPACLEVAVRKEREPL
jgi:hypothetical protein